MNPAFLKKIKRNDRLAHWAITLGGLAIIFCVIFILVLIVEVSLPLFLAPDARQVIKFQATSVDAAEAVLAVGMDDYLETGYTINTRGQVHFMRLKDGQSLDTIRLVPPGEASRLIEIESYGRLNHVLRWQDGAVSIE